VRDFVDKILGKVAPYGIYDVAANTGWVSLGIDHDTAEFAVNAVRRWHQVVDSVRYPTAERLLITADSGSRVAVVDLIAATTTKTGLTVQCELDENSYAKGIKVTEAEMATLNIESDPWHPERNYTINPRPPGRSGNS
jgi:hypothetical protein